MKGWIEEIKKRTIAQVPLVTSGRSDKSSGLTTDDLVFVPAQLDKKPVDYFRQKINSKTVIGSQAKKPLVLSMPILIGAMSFGALSKKAKIVLAKAATKAGTATNTGEGGMLPEERKYSQLLVAQYSTARFGIDERYLKAADALEIKIGQGAKPGMGGFLPGQKVTKEIAKIRKVKMGQDIHSPASHQDINNLDDLKRKVSWLRKVSGGKPIIIKLAAGNVEKDIKIAVEASADIIALDGRGGGTGAAPEVIMDHVGLPILPALVRARKTLDKMKAKQELIVGGGLNKGADFAKVLALGAKAVFLGFPLVVAMGCNYCRLCYQGKCPQGITTQDKVLTRKLNIAKAVERVVNYLATCNEEIKMITAAVGKNNVHDLDKSDLRALDCQLARALGIEYV